MFWLFTDVVFLTAGTAGSRIYAAACCTIIFDFLGLTENAQERNIERALTQHITGFLLELGAGFAFVGRQYRLDPRRFHQPVLAPETEKPQQLVAQL